MLRWGGARIASLYTPRCLSRSHLFVVSFVFWGSSVSFGEGSICHGKGAKRSPASNANRRSSPCYWIYHLCTYYSPTDHPRELSYIFRAMQMESGASLATRNPCLLASPRAKVGLGTVRFPGFQRRMRGARLVANGGASWRWSVSLESNLSCDLREGGGRERKNALARIYGFGDFGVTTLAIRAFKKKFFDFESFLHKDHEDGDDEEEEGGRHRGGRASDDDDTSSTDEETSSTDEETSSTDEEDTSEDEDDDDERECDD